MVTIAIREEMTETEILFDRWLEYERRNRRIPNIRELYEGNHETFSELFYWQFGEEMERTMPTGLYMKYRLRQMACQMYWFVLDGDVPINQPFEDVW